MLQHRLLLPHSPPIKVNTRWGELYIVGEPFSSRPLYWQVLVQLVRDLSGPEAPFGCMLLDTV